MGERVASMRKLYSSRRRAEVAERVAGALQQVIDGEPGVAGAGRRGGWEAAPTATAEGSAPQ
eukprot:212749-Prorocentrum_minimum.AAC.1